MIIASTYIVLILISLNIIWHLMKKVRKLAELLKASIMFNIETMAIISKLAPDMDETIMQLESNIHKTLEQNLH